MVGREQVIVVAATGPVPVALTVEEPTLEEPFSSSDIPMPSRAAASGNILWHDDSEQFEIRAANSFWIAAVRSLSPPGGDGARAAGAAVLRCIGCRGG